MPASPPNLKKNSEKRKRKNIFFLFFLSFNEAFQVWRARRHSVVADTMPTGSLDLKYIKKKFQNFILFYFILVFFEIFLKHFKFGGPIGIVLLPTLCLRACQT
jgi:hypothetical protein